MPKKSLYIIIAGCGRLGASMAGFFSKKGHSVVVIDRDPKSFENLPPEFTGFKIQGDVVELENIKNAQIKKADIFLALTNDDNTNFMISQVVRKLYKVSQVIARVYDPENIQLFESSDIDTICPMKLAMEKLIEDFGEVI
ncbi:MAG: TrkA family potassium uptake protein [Thermotogae bacterium]|nr:TrkA family potassium uptake protein [Thermotogota bacterium]